MLINTSKHYETGDVITFKLVNGDELVARLVRTDTDSYFVESPCAVVPSGQGIGLMQAVFTCDPSSEFELKKNHVMLSGPTIKGMVNHYVKTTSGIEIAPAGSI